MHARKTQKKKTRANLKQHLTLDYRVGRSDVSSDTETVVLQYVCGCVARDARYV